MPREHLEGLLAAPLYVRIMEAYRAGDMATAQAGQSRAREMVNVLAGSGGLAAVKPIMRLMGVDCGVPRLPLPALDESRCRKLRADLERVGFFDYSCRV